MIVQFFHLNYLEFNFFPDASTSNLISSYDLDDFFQPAFNLQILMMTDCPEPEYRDESVRLEYYSLLSESNWKF